MSVAEPGTIKDLVEDSVRIGVPLTERAIRDWIERGLLDNPPRGAGRGRGAGSHRAVFTGNQRQLFQAMLQHRAKGVSLKLLANLPVYLWLYWGDSYVSVSQVRRAMQTWAADGSTSRGRARAAAEQIVSQFAGPKASETARRKLLRLIVDSAIRGKVEGDHLLSAFRAVVDSDDPTATNVLPDPEFFIDFVRWRIQTVDQLVDIPDHVFIAARIQHLVQWNQYVARDRAALRALANQSLQSMFAEPTVEDMVNDSCSNLLANLALIRQFPDGPPRPS